jgi:UDPglucose 6-dehydrogenase
MPKINKKIGIIGVGMVGGALRNYFESIGVKPFLYDKFQKLGSVEEVNRAEVVFVVVPTPYDQKTKKFDDSYIKAAFKILKSPKTVIIKSTVLPGTTERFQKQYPKHKVFFNPEFLTELTADQDMRFPDRQIIGYTSKSYNIAKDILHLLPLAPFERIMPATAAEMVKYFGNNWFAVKVAYANQMYDLCQKIGVDYDTVMEAAAADKRIGRSHLEVWHKGYRGYGGKCLPKDIKALIAFADSKGVSLEVHKAAERVNNQLMKDQHIKDPEKFSKRE